MAEANPWADISGAGPSKRAAAGSASTSTSVTSGDSGHSRSRGMLLLVFIHGFKGSAETTFEDYPNRLAHLVGETHPGLTVEPIIYPTYDTRGQLAVAVENFVEWLVLQTIQRESKPVIDAETGEEKPFEETGRGGGRGSVRVCLLGHSMGGLVAVDSALRLSTNPDGSVIPAEEVWPKVDSVVAYDSPYYGVHPNVFKNQASKYISYAQSARDLGTHFAPLGAGIAAAWGMTRNSRNSNDRSSSNGRPSAPAASTNKSWSSALWTTGVLATAATASGIAAYYNREQLGGAYSYLTDHFEYVRNLWDDEALRKRLDQLVQVSHVQFHAFYNRLPPSSSTSTSTDPPSFSSSLSSSLDNNNNNTNRKKPDRTFIVLPPLSSPSAHLFTPLHNRVAPDEVAAHIAMFDPRAEACPTYADMGLRTAHWLGKVIERNEGKEMGGVAGNGQSHMEGQGPATSEAAAAAAAKTGSGSRDEPITLDDDDDDDDGRDGGGDQGLRAGDAEVQREEAEVRQWQEQLHSHPSR